MFCLLSKKIINFSSTNFPWRAKKSENKRKKREKDFLQRVIGEKKRQKNHILWYLSEGAENLWTSNLGKPKEIEGESMWKKGIGAWKTALKVRKFEMKIQDCQILKA